MPPRSLTAQMPPLCCHQRSWMVLFPNSNETLSQREEEMIDDVAPPPFNGWLSTPSPRSIRVEGETIISLIDTQIKEDFRNSRGNCGSNISLINSRNNPWGLSKWPFYPCRWFVAPYRPPCPKEPLDRNPTVSEISRFSYAFAFWLPHLHMFRFVGHMGPNRGGPLRPSNKPVWIRAHYFRRSRSLPAAGPKHTGPSVKVPHVIGTWVDWGQIWGEKCHFICAGKLFM